MSKRNKKKRTLSPLYLSLSPEARQILAVARFEAKERKKGEIKDRRALLKSGWVGYNAQKGLSQTNVGIIHQTKTKLSHAALQRIGFDTVHYRGPNHE